MPAVQGVPVVVQEPVRVVLDDGDAEPVRESHESRAFLAVESNPARVVGVGYCIDESRPRPACQQRPGAVDVHAGVEVGADGQDGRPVRQDRLANAGVHLFFQEHLAARRHQQLGREAQRLLGPRRQQHLMGGAIDAPRAHELDDALSERLMGLAVLQSGVVAGQDVREGCGVGGAGYQLRGGEPPGERQEPGLRRKKRELAQARARESGAGCGGARRGPRAIQHDGRHATTTI